MLMPAFSKFSKMGTVRDLGPRVQTTWSPISHTLQLVCRYLLAQCAPYRGCTAAPLSVLAFSQTQAIRERCTMRFPMDDCC